MNPIKKIIYGNDARQLLADGVIEVANIVATTAGAAGRNVSISQNWGAPKITKDGVSVAKAVNLEGVKGDGAKLLIQAAEKTAKEAGDGTSANCILTRSILLNGLEKIKPNTKTVYIKRGIDMAVDAVVEKIKECSKKIESNSDIYNIALISSNGDKSIADIVTKAVTAVGENGTIMVENSSTDRNEVEVVDGISFDNGIISPYFITNVEKNECVLEHPYILMYDSRITNFKNLVKLLEMIYAEKRSLLIICDDVEDEVLASLIQNHIKGVVKCAVVKAPMIGDFRTGFMEDIACLTNGQYISSQLGVDLENVTLDMLGSASYVSASESRTIIRQNPKDMTDEIKENVSKRIDLLKTLIETAKSDYIKSTAEERLSKLDGGVAVVKVGGKTEAEVNEKKDRVDDAICATQSAREEGTVVGGGVTLYNIAKQLKNSFKDVKEKDIKIGIDILLNSLTAPMKQIIENTGFNYNIISKKIDKLVNDECGFDAAKCNIVNLREVGIIDSAKVIRCSLQNAASIAGSILTVNGVITNDVDEMIRYNKLLSK